MPFKGLVAVASAVLLVGLAACAVSPPPLDTPAPTPAPSNTVQPRVDKVLVFVLENHSLDQVKKNMPFTMGLLSDYAYATNFTAIRHPSLPNYLAIAGGSTFGIDNDKSPAKHPVSGPSVFGAAIAGGKTAAIYAESMSENCRTTNSAKYAVKHNPWAYFVDERDLCEQFDVSVTSLPAAIDAGALPNVGMVIPNLCNDAHDCSLSKADAWYKKWLPRVMDGPDYTSGRLAIVLTADEDNGSKENVILTGVIQKGLAPQVVTDPLTLYSLSRLLSDVADSAYLGEAAGAASMSDAFGLALAG